MASVDPRTVTDMYRSGREFALIDCREQWEFCRGHALLASSCPLSSAELLIEDLVPRKSATIVVMDGGPDAPGSMSGEAVRRLGKMGYTSLHVLDGGAKAWSESGYQLFSGIHVYGKLFGEFVEHLFETPEIDAADLAEALGSPSPPTVVDVRPRSEFVQATVPGALHIPAEMLLRAVASVAPDTVAPIVVHCGGRTRGIIAAQTLAMAGVPNPVRVLSNGTMGWRLAGFPTIGGVDAPLRLEPETADRARRYANSLLRQTTIERLDPAGLERTSAEAATITTYLIDVRSDREYEAAHHPAARHVPAGQLLQELDAVIGTRHSRVVLLDDLGDRAAFAGFWLQRAGWRDVRWFSYSDFRGALASGRRQRLVSVDGSADGCRYLSATELRGLIGQQRAFVLDLSTSIEYERGRIPGAVFAIRSRLPAGLLDVLPDDRSLIVLTCEDGTRARLAGIDLRDRYGDRLRQLLGGNRAWREAGMEIEEGSGNFLHPPHDVRRSIYHQPSDILAAMREYLGWEIALPGDARNEDYLRFRW